MEVVSERRAARAADVLPVTAVIPLYDRERTVGRALESVLGQRPAAPAQIIVVDDGSTDTGPDIARLYGAEVITHASNRGLSAARNTGLAAAAHDWVALLDSDDEWLPHHLDLLWTLREDHALVGATSMRIGAGPAHGLVLGPMPGRGALRAPRDVLYPFNPLAPSAAMVRRDAVLGIGGFRPWEGVIEDMDLWVRLLVHHTGFVSSEVGVLYHVHATQMSGDHDRMGRAVRAALASYEGHGWCSARTRRLREGVVAWDTASASGRASVRLRVLASPLGALGAAGALAARALNRRRSARWTAHGRPTVAILPGAAEGARDRLPAGAEAVDMSSYGFARATWVLLQRPTSFATYSGLRWRLPLRVLGIRPWTGSSAGYRGDPCRGIP